MYDIERQEKILAILHEEKSCSVSRLAKLLSFSEATIRRDLNALDKAMKVRKTFGGAVLPTHYGTKVPQSLRQQENAALKKALCHAAAALIRENMTIFLDASTTIEPIVPYLAEFRHLTVVTNHPDLPKMLADTSVTVYCTGGKYLHHSHSYIGEFARNTIRSINADLLLFSARGIGADGRITNSSTDDDIHKVMLENAAHTCLLADSTKMNKTFAFTFAHLAEIDTVITDRPLPPPLQHPNVIVAKA